jgi:hypothetical protein
VIYVPPRWQSLCTLPPGTVTDRLVDFTDFGPTVLSLAGISTPEHMQGRAFMGEHEQAAKKYQFGIRCNAGDYFDPIRTVYDGRFRYVRSYTPFKPLAVWQDFQWQMPAQRAWDRLYSSGNCPKEYRQYYDSKPSEMLFDLSVDLGELTNLADSPDHQQKLGELRKALSGWLRESRDKGLVPLQMRDRTGEPSMYDRMETVDFPLEELYRAAETASRARPEDAAVINGWLCSETPEIRYWGAVGCTVLARDKHPVPFSQLETLLTDPHKDIAFTAAEALWYSGSAEKAYNVLIAGFLENNEFAVRSIEMFTLAGDQYIGAALHDRIVGDMRRISEAGSSGMQKHSARAILTRTGALDTESVYSKYKIDEAKKRYLQNRKYNVSP